MNRVGRRMIFAMLLIAAVVAIWALLGGRWMYWSTITTDQEAIIRLFRV
jgi:hypothetical protein